MARIRKRRWATRSGKSRTAWQVDYRDSHGKRRAKTFGSRSEAVKWAERTNLESVNSERDEVTFEDAARAWLDRAEVEGVATTTLRGYRYVVYTYLIPGLGPIQLDMLDQPTLVAFRKEMMLAHSEALAAHVAGHANMILRYAWRAGLTARNIPDGMKTTKSARHKKRPSIPSRDELRQILAACRVGRSAAGPPTPMHRRNELLLKTMMETAIRPCEARAIAWAQVDLEKGEIEILRDANRHGTIGPCKTKASYRHIPISPVLALELKSWKKLCPPSPFDLVFPTKSGRVIAARRLNYDFNRLQMVAGLTKIVVDKFGTPILTKSGETRITWKYKLYDLRHAAASWWIHKRVDLKRLTTWMAHSSIQVTVDIYGHLIEDTAFDQAIMAELAADLYRHDTWLTVAELQPGSLQQPCNI